MKRCEEHEEDKERKKIALDFVTAREKSSRGKQPRPKTRNRGPIRKQQKIAKASKTERFDVRIVGVLQGLMCGRGNRCWDELYGMYSISC